MSEAAKRAMAALDELITVELASTEDVRHRRIGKLCAIADALKNLYAERVAQVQNAPNNILMGGMRLGGMGDFAEDYEMPLPVAGGHNPDVVEMMRQMVTAFQDTTKKRNEAIDAAPNYFDTPVRQLDELLRVRRELAGAGLPVEAVDEQIHDKLAALKAERVLDDMADEHADEEHAA